jgi:hypothetical protein
VGGHLPAPRPRAGAALLRRRGRAAGHGVWVVARLHRHRTAR